MIMEPADWYIEGCVSATTQEVDRFNNWTSHLPKREESTPCHSGPHSVKHFHDALAIVNSRHEHKVVTALEVGFCLGHSAEIMLRLGVSMVTSVDNSDRQQTTMAWKAMREKWGSQFDFIYRQSGALEQGAYDFGFVDGDHSASGIREDVELMRKARVPWVLFDDFWPHWGDTQIVFKEQGITPVAILGTMALCHFPA